MEQLIIRSKDQLFEEFVVEALKEHVSTDDIRANLIEAMRKEVFGQMMWRMKVDDLRNAPKTPKNEEIVLKITEQARKKWHSLVKECNKWTETLNLISDDDLLKIWDNEEEAEETEEEESEEESEIDEMTAEWPELSEEPEPAKKTLA